MLKAKVIETIKNYDLIRDGDKVVIGVSGGPDSICLLDVLHSIMCDKKIDFDMIVCHVNHMIREEAKDDEEFVKKYCKDKNIICETKEIDIQSIAKQNKMGTEETGREERYKFFEETLQKYSATKIATAHTKCDNSETVLMNIIRGTGTSRIERDTT